MKAGSFSRKMVAGAVLAAVLAIPASAAADTFTVTNSQASGAGSLRQAIADANAHPGHDKIEFAAGVTRIILSPPDQPGPVKVTGDVDIDGPGAGNLEVFGFAGGAFEIMRPATVAISGMSIRHSGAFDSKGAGGAILNDGTLTLTGLVLQQNMAVGPSGGRAAGGAISNSGTLTLEDSTLTDNSAGGRDGGEGSGGAIANSGTMTVDHSRLEGNRAGGGDTTGENGGDAKGGAIANTGDLTVVDSTLTRNAARGGAGHLEGGAGLGGAIYNSGGGTLTVRRSTLDNNTAQGGGATVGSTGVGGLAIGGAIENFDPATFRIENSTITGNDATSFGGHRETQSFGGGIDNQSTFQHQSTVLDTTIAGNVAFNGSNIANSSASLSLQDTILANPVTPDHQAGENCGHPGGVPSAFIKSLGYNIDSGTSCELKATGDRSDTDPGLMPLADNGGSTQTMAISLSSKALDQGVSGGLNTDQRGSKRPVLVPGVPRPQGGDGSDIGAYEFQPGPAGNRRIAGTVRPGDVEKGERTCFEFTAERESGAPINNAQVRFAGKRRRTNEDGEAALCKTLRKRGERHPRIRKRGYERDRLTVDVSP